MVCTPTLRTTQTHLRKLLKLAEQLGWPVATRKKRLELLTTVTTVDRMLEAAAEILVKAATTPHAASKALTQLRWAAEFNGINVKILSDVGKAIRKKAAAKGKTKAHPISERALIKLFPSLYAKEPIMASLAWLAWVTCSRIDDLVKLVPKAFTFENEFLVINFRFTKANPTAEPREDHAMAVPANLVPQFVKESFPKWPVTQRDQTNLKARFYRQLRHTEVTSKREAQPGVKWRTTYTLHSFKLGAGQVLLEAAANGDIPTEVISLVMKHKRAKPILEATTVGYLANTLHTAIATGATKASTLLASRLAVMNPMLCKGQKSKRCTRSKRTASASRKH